MPLLPAEILELVFTFLRDDTNTLRALSLVSFDFLPISRHFLFSHIFLLPEPRQPTLRSCSLATRTSPINQDYTPGPRSESLSPYVPASRSSPVAQRNPQSEPHSGNACTRLIRLLSMSPHIGHYIQRVTVIDGRLFPSQDLPLQNDPLFTRLGLDDVQSPHHFEIRDKLNGPQWFLFTPPRVLYLLFQKLHIRIFDLVFQGGPRVSWNDILRDTRGALNYLFASPSLDTLELRSVSWDTPTTLREFMRVLSRGSIKHLTLRNVKLLSPTPSPGQTRPSSSRHHDRDQPGHSGPQLHQNHRTRGRSPTPRSDSPPLHVLQAQAQTHYDQHTCFTLPSAKPNQNRQNQNQPFPKPANSSLSPYSHSPCLTPLPRDHYDENVDDNKTHEVLCLDSLSITSLPSSQDPDGNSATLDLLRTLLLSQLSGPRPQPNLHPHLSGNQSPDFKNVTQRSSFVRSYDLSHTQYDFANVEGPLVNPYTLKKLSIPDVSLKTLSEVIDTLSQCKVLMTGLEALMLNEQLLGSPTPPLVTSPNSNTAALDNSAPIINFSIFESLRTLKLGAQIPLMFNVPSTIFHQFPSTSSSSSTTRAPPHSGITPSPSGTGYSRVRHLSWLSQALQTLPPGLEKLSIQFTIDESAPEDEMRHTLDQLRIIQRQRPRMRIDVSKKVVSSYHSRLGSTSLSMVRSDSGGGDGGYYGLRGSGRGRAMRGRAMFG